MRQSKAVSTLVAVTAWLCAVSLIRANEPLASRTPWTQSRLQGSPEPPLPYVFERAFAIEFSGPMSLNRIPHTNRYLVCEQTGMIYAFDGSQASPHKHPCCDFNATVPPTAGLIRNESIQLYSLAFDPEFAVNRWVYICYFTQGGQRTTQMHISRFVLPDAIPEKLDLTSELAILKCEGGGHNGCTLAFGNDGYLYISLGDLADPNPPDLRNTGQDISDLYSSIIRIDVHQQSAEQNYAIPPDNPFVDLPTARPEVYAYGLRNPFRMSFDPPTGDLWVGDVGWEAWEMVYRVRPGGNYGWAIKEGPGDVKNQTPGPTPILPADIALNHSEAASITGGMVYRGQKYPDLTGTYIFGDWITRKFWSARFDAERVLDYREIAMGSVKPICFEADSDGELLVMDYNDFNQPAGIFRLVPNPLPASSANDFPRLLSETGLLADTAAYVPMPGVVRYTIQAPMWMNGAQADYLLAIPGTDAAAFYETPQKMFDWFRSYVMLPQGSVLAKTYRLDHERGAQRIETQLSVKDEQDQWQFYSYRWNESGTDAQLVPSEGELGLIELPAQNQNQNQVDSLPWQFGSRTSCRICHTPWTGETLGFIEPQLRSPRAASDSWHELMASGHIRVAEDNERPSDAYAATIVDPADASQPLDLRARSYLHTNCGHCHLNGGNASTSIDVSIQKLLSETGLVDKPPIRGDLGLSGTSLLTPGRPDLSILFWRLAKSGAGRMPHIGPHTIDPSGVQLIKQWIAELPADPEIRSWLDELCAPRHPELRDAERLAAGKHLLASQLGATELAGALAEGRVPQRLVRSIVAESLAADAIVRDLIEPYAAPDQRVPRLGTSFQPEQIWSLQGNADEGQRLFAQGVGSCSSCHRLDSIGKELGPDLSQLEPARKSSQSLLKSIMQPSLEIDEKYRAVSILTDTGQVSVGRIISRDASQIILQEASGNLVEISVETVEQEKVSAVSLMPDNLLAPLTAQQAADLLAYLQTR